MIRKRTNLPKLSPSNEPLTQQEIEESFWPSPAGLIVPSFLRHVSGMRYAEVCAGNGKLIKHLQDHASCVWASDIYPRHARVLERNALTLTKEEMNAQCAITNPPFSSKFVYPLIDHFIHIGLPLWLFLPLEFSTRATSALVLPFCSHILAVGPVKFIEDSLYKGETQFAWYRFGSHRTKTIFEGLETRYNSRKVPLRLKERA